MDIVFWWGAELLVWMESHAVAAAVVAAALMVPGLVCCWAARRGARVAERSMARIDQRLTQIYSAVALLTDTTESSLRDAFAEIEKLAEDAGVRSTPRAGLEQRVTTAARDGRTAREIAIAEGVSEGEVRLRLRLYGENASTAAPAA